MTPVFATFEQPVTIASTRSNSKRSHVRQIPELFDNSLEPKIKVNSANGSRELVLYASILDLIGKGRVIGVDVEIRKYNRLALQSHPLSRRFTLVEGSSVDPATADQLREMIQPDERVLVALDSNHSAAHVAKELEMYAPMVTPDSYLVVFDGVMQVLTDAPGGSPDWDKDNPWQAVQEFLDRNDEFEVDPYYNRLKVTYCPGGFLKRVTKRKK